MRIFLDTNIIASVLLKETPRMRASAAVMSLIDSRRFDVYTSALTLATCFYLSEKKFGKTAAKLRLDSVANHLNIARCDVQEVRSAFSMPAIEDFEDGLQYFAAKRQNCQAIITYDQGGFYYSDIPVYSPDDFLLTLIHP
ncbi:MAG: PIN domain-containing protein [Bacteroidetes bacterium]|nr:PIN domain-containing protein [Bacteroidota bacterium]MBS1629212.1 PIN domain-containing protein [Bacteroidota bacterium]